MLRLYPLFTVRRKPKNSDVDGTGRRQTASNHRRWETVLVVAPYPPRVHPMLRSPKECIVATSFRPNPLGHSIILGEEHGIPEPICICYCAPPAIAEGCVDIGACVHSICTAQSNRPWHGHNTLPYYPSSLPETRLIRETTFSKRCHQPALRLDNPRTTSSGYRRHGGGVEFTIALTRQAAHHSHVKLRIIKQAPDPNRNSQRKTYGPPPLRTPRQ